MKEKYIKEVLEKVKDGGLAVDDAYEQLRDLPFKDIGFANVDNHRAVRTGFPEVVFCQGKTPRQIAQIMAELVKNVWPKVEAGMLKPSIYKILPITEAEAAHAILERGENIGKVILSVKD